MSNDKAHALLGASSAKRWLACPPSVRLGESFGADTPSTYAAEGTLAHEICELKLRKKFTEPGMSQATFTRRMNKLKKHELYQDEMQACSDEYVDVVNEAVLSYPTAPYIAVEKRVDYSAVAPEGFGTADCILIGGDTLHVIDYKHGKGIPVDADENPQLMLYAVGALMEYDMFYPIEQVKLTIVQPRLSSVSEWAVPADKLRTWANEVVKPRAQLAYEGKGDYASGDHCRFCRAKSICRKRADDNLAIAKHNFDMPPRLSHDEVGQILMQARNLKSWVADLEEWALHEALLGYKVPGWKPVEGRRSRAFTNADEAFDVLTANGTDEALLYNRVPLTLAQVEKLIGKAKFAELLGDKVVSTPGKPTLVPESDKRPIYKLAAAQQAFGGAENNTKEVK